VVNRCVNTVAVASSGQQMPDKMYAIRSVPRLQLDIERGYQ